MRSVRSRQEPKHDLPLAYGAPAVPGTATGRATSMVLAHATLPIAMTLAAASAHDIRARPVR
jgi:hypothetical protein